MWRPVSSPWFRSAVGGSLLLAVLLGWQRHSSAPPRTQGSLPQAAYVWQRAWTPPVRAALAQHTEGLDRLVVLAAEVRFVSGRPQVTRVRPDLAAVPREQPVGLALRLGPFGGPFQRSDDLAQRLTELAASLVAEARAQGREPVEFQLDFDCAEAKLAGYQHWVEAVRDRIRPVPLTLTVLPSWLDQRAFAGLVRASDGFVLQVHAVQRPQSPADSVALCDPLRARTWVEQAARAGVPFRVALPTYSYLVAFDARGRFAGASAEGPDRDWPADFTFRELAADPVALAGLVTHWTKDRPRLLEGLIWYRLPVATDRWNWDAATLASVRRGAAPVAVWQVETASPEPGLVEVRVRNQGPAKSMVAGQVQLRWSADGRLLAGDALAGFQLDTEATRARWLAVDDGRLVRPLLPGEARSIGWLRFDRPMEVQGELRP